MVASHDFSSLLRLLFEYLYSAPIFKGITILGTFVSNDPLEDFPPKLEGFVSPVSVRCC